MVFRDVPTKFEMSPIVTLRHRGGAGFRTGANVQVNDGEEFPITIESRRHWLPVHRSPLHDPPLTWVPVTELVFYPCHHHGWSRTILLSYSVTNFS